MPTGKLFMDRLFDKTRTELTENCFQNERLINYELYRKNEIEYVCTLQPKRMYFIDDDRLVEKGVKIYFRFNSSEKYTQFKSLLWFYFQRLYFISPKLYSTEGEVKEGYILLTNQKEKDISKCIRETIINA